MSLVLTTQVYSVLEMCRGVSSASDKESTFPMAQTCDNNLSQLHRM